MSIASPKASERIVASSKAAEAAADHHHA